MDTGTVVTMSTRVRIKPCVTSLNVPIIVRWWAIHHVVIVQLVVNQTERNAWTLMSVWQNRANKSVPTQTALTSVVVLLVTLRLRICVVHSIVSVFIYFFVSMKGSLTISLQHLVVNKPRSCSSRLRTFDNFR
jgi:hypothetical protein